MVVWRESRKRLGDIPEQCHNVAGYANAVHLGRHDCPLVHQALQLQDLYGLVCCARKVPKYPAEGMRRFSAMTCHALMVDAASETNEAVVKHRAAYPTGICVIARRLRVAKGAKIMLATLRLLNDFRLDDWRDCVHNASVEPNEG
jgi:hypothetical protein